MGNSEAPPARLGVESPPEAVSARIRKAIARTPSSTLDVRARISSALTVALALSAGVVLIASRIVYHRYAPGLEVPASSAPYTMIVLLLLVALTLVATLLAIWRGRRGFGSEAMVLLLTIGLVAPVYAALVLVSPGHGYDPTAIGVAPLHWPLLCLSLSGVVGLLVSASLAIALRRSIPVGTRLRGAAIGAAAGAWAGLGVFIFCPHDNLRHLFIGHVLPIWLLTVLGMIVVPRVVRL